MSALERSIAFDSRFENGVYSGLEQDADSSVETLTRDYERLSHEPLPAESSSAAQLGSSNRSSGGPFYENGDQIDLDTIVAPFSKRKREKLSGIGVRTFSPVAEWEGYVESIGSDDFVVRMTNLKSGTELPTDEATFQKVELSDYQMKLLREGAIIRWVIGLERLPSDQRRRVSELHFRRLPAHSQSDYDRALKKAEKLIGSIEWDD